MSNQLSNGLLARRRRVNDSLPDPTFTWVGQTRTGAGSSHSPTLGGLGADYAERYVLVAVRWDRQGVSAANLSSVSFNGQPATSIISGGTSDPGSTLLYLLKVPTGTSITSSFVFTGAVVVTLTWSILTDLQSMVPVSTGRATGNNPSVNVAIPDKGVAFGYWSAGYGVDPGTNSWSSPMIMDLNNNIATQFRHSVGHRIAASDIASYNVQHFFNYSGSLVAASFR